MKFPAPLNEGKLVKRYKRFFADLEHDGKIITAHVPNTGSLLGCLEQGSPCLFTLSDDPKRKLPATLHFIKTKTSWVGVNTSLPNRLAWEAFRAKQIPHWKDFTAGQLEVKINDKSRIDLALWNENDGPRTGVKLSTSMIDDHRLHFVEIKNVTLARDGVALFPDSVTERGQKHLTELMALARRGHSAEILFVIQRTDCKMLSPAHDIDPAYGRLLQKAREAGVKISGFQCGLENDLLILNPEALEIRL